MLLPVTETVHLGFIPDHQNTVRNYLHQVCRKLGQGKLVWWLLENWAGKHYCSSHSVSEVQYEVWFWIQFQHHDSFLCMNLPSSGNCKVTQMKRVQ